MQKIMWILPCAIVLYFATGMRRRIILYYARHPYCGLKWVGHCLKLDAKNHWMGITNFWLRIELYYIAIKLRYLAWCIGRATRKGI